jgi:hypothetical protein
MLNLLEFNMLKTLLFAVLATFSASAHALPYSRAVGMPNPCAPTVQARPSRLNCVQDGLVYSIVVETLMSRPSARCSGRRHLEYKTAKIEVTSQSNGGMPVANLEIFNGAFSYELGFSNNGNFVSESLGLRLNSCSSPLGGGFSVGN